MNRKERRALQKRGVAGKQPSPANFQNLFATAFQCHQRGQLIEAEALYQKALSLNPRHADSLNLLGALAHQTGRHQKGAELIGQAIAINPKSALYRDNLGSVLQALGRHKDAIPAHKEAIELKPDFADAHYNLGNALYAAGRLDESIDAFSAAIALAPNHPGAHNNYGTALRDAGRVIEAIDAFRTAIRCAPEFAKAHFNLGNALRGMGRFQEAVAAYKDAIRIEPRFADAHNNLGATLEELGVFEEAAAALGAAIHSDGSNAGARSNLGNVLRKMGKAADAVTAYRAALRLKPGHAETYNNLGHALADLGEIEEAARAYVRAAELGHKSAHHLAAALQGHTTETAPPEYVSGLFDSYASKFDAHLTEVLDYQSPRRLRQLIDRACEGVWFKRAADLGCGTGLSGAEFKDRADELIGVDLSAKMLAIAEKKQIYAKLVHSDILSFLDASGQRFDLFLLADAVIYVGALENLFSLIARRALPGAILALSAEICEGGSFQLLKSGRYAHSRSYLENQLAKIDARVLAFETMEIRKENGIPCYGHYIIASLASAPL